MPPSAWTCAASRPSRWAKKSSATAPACKVVKNKVAPPFRTAEFDIMFNEGISKVGDVLDLATKFEIIQKRGAFFSYGDIRLGQGRENAKEFLRQNPDLAAEIEAVIRQKAMSGEIALPLDIGAPDGGDDAAGGEEAKHSQGRSLASPLVLLKGDMCCSHAPIRWLVVSLLLLSGCAPLVTSTPFIPPAAPPLPSATFSPEPGPPLDISTPTPIPASPTTISVSPEPTGESCTNDLAYDLDLTVPDGTIVQPGASIEKQWLVTNSGTCDWNGSYRLKLVGGDTLGAAPEQALYPALAGAQVTLQINFTAPLSAGTYQSGWQAFDPDGNAFGDLFYMTITVSG